MPKNRMIKGDYGRRSRSRALFLNDLLIGRASSSIFNASVLGLNDVTKFLVTKRLMKPNVMSGQAVH